MTPAALATAQGSVGDLAPTVDAFSRLRTSAPGARADLLAAIAAALHAQREVVLPLAAAETALAPPRLAGEWERMLLQWRTGAALVREGAWLQAIIDRGDPRRVPLPRPDVRRCLVPLGPVAVFAASNFPFAFGSAGGDTVAALAAGCPVVLRPHPAHPRTAALLGAALARGLQEAGFPAGTIAVVADPALALAHALVAHPAIQAVAFTGSAAAGQALLATAQARPQPIPVYAEMGSVNPVLLLPRAVQERGPAIARQLAAAVTGSLGQLCTKPGLIIGGGPGWPATAAALTAAVTASPPGVLLHAGVATRFAARSAALAAIAGAPSVASAPASGEAARSCRPCVFHATAAQVLAHASLREELFGPATVLVTAEDAAAVRALVEALPGQLTGTLHATQEDAVEHAAAIDALAARCGRLIYGGVPTGVEVVPAMHHGGPFPAASDGRASAVGTGWVERFARPLCLQQSPDAWLPPSLQDANPWGILRQVDGVWTRAPVLRPPP